MPPPPLPKDREHLRTLVVCHYVAAGLVVPGLGFLGLHYTLMKQVFGNPEMWAKMKDKPPFDPVALFEIFQWIYPVVALIFIGSAVLAWVSGRCIRQRKGRMFSIVVAALNCLHVPLGLVLGIFTFIVLNRESVMRLYEDEASGEGETAAG